MKNSKIRSLAIGSKYMENGCVCEVIGRNNEYSTCNIVGVIVFNQLVMHSKNYIMKISDSENCSVIAL